VSRSRISQAVLAAVLNISLSTVQKWEAGDKKPSGPSLKLLNQIERKGLEAVLEDEPDGRAVLRESAGKDGIRNAL
jgi:transcriptional regulator with XRE-family HTH domain